MRKLTLILMVLCGVSSVFAQKSKVNGALSYLTSGKLDKAKEAIDQGIRNEKCISYPKAYLVKGKVYQGIFESPLPAYKKLAKNPLDVAYAAYLKALELDEKGKMLKPVQEQMTNMIPNYTNRAVNCYNSEDYKGALDAFEKVLEIKKMDMFKSMPIDTAIIFNAGMAAQKSEDFDKAAKYYKQAVDYNYGGAKSYANLSHVLKRIGKEEESIAYLHKGFELYPDDSWMLVELINYYMLGGEPQKAADYLDKAISLDPKNASFYRAKGTLFEKSNNTKQAEKMYEKALELEPNDFTSQYNLGLLKLNAVIAQHKEANDIDGIKEYKEAIKLVYDGYEKVIPYFERVLELKPDEINSLKTLQELYYKLRDKKPEYKSKYEMIESKLNALEVE